MPKLISIPVSDIIMNVEDNSRRFTAASVENMTLQLLDANRQLEPVGVVKYKTGENKGKYRLMYGFRRVHALKDILEGQLAPEGSPLYAVQALLHEDMDANDDKTVFLTNVAENAHRQEMTAMDQALSITKMMDEFGLNNEAVAKCMGVSKSRVSQLKALMKLPLEIQQAIENNDLSSTLGYEISKEKTEEKQMEVFYGMMGKSNGKKPTLEDAKETRRALADADTSDGSSTPADAATAARALSATRSWKAIVELLDIYRLTDDKKLMNNRQKFIEALIAFRDGGAERTFRRALEMYVPE